MSARSGHELRERIAGSGPGTSTLASRLDLSRAVAEATMFGDVEEGVRLHMELVVRASNSPDAALPAVIELLVPGDRTRQRAIIQAISTNEPLREQWERTWEVLRR